VVWAQLQAAFNRRIGSEVLLHGTQAAVLDRGPPLDDAGDRGGPTIGRLPKGIRYERARCLRGVSVGKDTPDVPEQIGQPGSDCEILSRSGRTDPYALWNIATENYMDRVRGERAEIAALKNEIDGCGTDIMQTFGNALPQKRNPNAVESIEKPGLDLFERDEVRTKRPSMWNVVFYNDDYTPMEFVEFVLRSVFHISMLDALALTLVVHTKGKGIAGTYTFEVAEQKQSEVLLMAKIEEHPLRVGVERD
jgi:ATP-dependent Clp protease adaptor protein ClpS